MLKQVHYEHQWSHPSVTENFWYIDCSLTGKLLCAFSGKLLQRLGQILHWKCNKVRS